MWASATRRRGFSLIELLVVIGIIGILASLILSSVTRAKGSGLKTECLSNQAQLVKTWALYATDNNGDLVSNYRWRKRAAAAVGTTGNDRYHKSWVMGTGHPNIGGMVDKSFLLDESVAAFAPYLRKPEIYRCPTSREVIAGTEAIRSYSMNPYMGCYEERAFSRNYFKFTHLDDVTRPDHYFVFADINQKYVCLPFMVIHMDRDAWHHPPATVHNFGGTLSFADGHVEYKRWREDATQGSATHPNWNNGPHTTLTKPGDQDLAWIRDHASFQLNRSSSTNSVP